LLSPSSAFAAKLTSKAEIEFLHESRAVLAKSRWWPAEPVFQFL